MKDNESYAETAFIDYGKAGLNSYTVGMIFFRLMFDLVGENNFNKIVGGFYKAYQASGATTEEFVQYVKSNSAVDLEHFFNEWAYSPIYAGRLTQYLSYNELLRFYQSNNQVEPNATP